MNLKGIIEKIDKNGDLYILAMKEASNRQLDLIKPPKSLGVLEDISIRLSGITGNLYNTVKNKAIVIMCGDNGVVEEGVASAPQTVTLCQTINFTKSKTGATAISKYFNIPVLVVDVGNKYNIPPEFLTDNIIDENNLLTKKIVNRKLGYGTKNLAKDLALTKDEVLSAINVGIEAVEAFKKTGVEIFGVGEMGIGNTTTSACILSAITKEKGKTVAGRGGGLTDKGLLRKIEVVDNSTIGLNPNGYDNIINILSKVGGFEICAMVGAYLGAALYRIPVVIDGYVSAVAALCSKCLCEKTVNFMFSSHKSKEPGYMIAMESLGLRPMFDLEMRLGEGSGTPIAFNIIETACAAMNNMSTFNEGGIDPSYFDEVMKGNGF